MSYLLYANSHQTKYKSIVENGLGFVIDMKIECLVKICYVGSALLAVCIILIT